MMPAKLGSVWVEAFLMASQMNELSSVEVRKPWFVELVLDLECGRGVAVGAHPATQAVSDGVVS
jgi:hypothetical protein